MKSDRSMFSPSILFIFLLAISCAHSPPTQREVLSPQIEIKEIESSRQVKLMNEKILSSFLSSNKEPYRDYKIGPEDLLEVSVFEEEKLNKTVRVSSQGNISLPLFGILKVKGLTANELEKEIRDLLVEKYLQDPHVSVFIKEYRSQRISVIGAVEKPGVFDVTGQKTVLDIMAMAGGLKEDAGQLLFLIRPPRLEDGGIQEKKGSEEQTIKTFVIDLEDLLVKGDLTLNFLLTNGDVMNIPVSGKIFVGGEVRSPGGFPLKGKKLTISQAITLAGGMKTEANGSETKIFRYSEKGTDKEILSTNVYAIQKGKEEDLYLKENDIIIVPKSGTKTFFSEFWDFLKGRVGAVGLGSL
ncbi:MAG: polysaccharide biosynthesis/export family protein [Deltaproteobacteria bacterium]|nr:polysaccharide biosynthesis/export family protein [Deltaproteobacteria bacterium]